MSNQKHPQGVLSIEEAEKKTCYLSLSSDVDVCCLTTGCMAWRSLGMSNRYPEPNVEIGYCAALPEPKA